MPNLAREMEAYKAILPTLLDQQGKFVVIAEGKVLGVFSTYDDALEYAYKQRGLEPFLLKQIAQFETAHYSTRAACPA